MLTRRLQRAGLLAMALAVPLWWGGLHNSATFRALFVSEANWEVLRTFLVPDTALAAITAVAAWRQSSMWRGATIGGWAYSTAWSLSAGASGALRPVGVVSMLAAMAAILVLTHEGLSARSTRRH